MNEEKFKRQEEGVEKYVASKGRGTLEYCTGFGKTFTAFLIIKRMLQRDSSRTTIVIVPTIQLKEQWETKIRKEKLKGVSVYVINTVALNEVKYSCSLLILDEIHRYASEEFKKIFDLISYHFILGLTATLNRLDGKHDLLAKHAPVIDIITIEEALEKGWVSHYFEYNFGIKVNDIDKERYNQINKEFHKHFAYFGHDFHLAMACCKKTGAEAYAEKAGMDKKEVAYHANRFFYFMRERKEYLYKADCKLKVVLEIIDKFKLKTITFSESTEFADQLTSALGDIALSYHTKLKTETRVVGDKPKKFGAIKLKKEALKKFADNRFRERVLNTAKALDQGADFEDIELAIITSSTTNPTQHTQRVGRAIRKYLYKDKERRGQEKISLIINIYVKDTQDEKWLKARQTDPRTGKPINPNIIYIENLNEITYGRSAETTPINIACE